MDARMGDKKQSVRKWESILLLLCVRKRKIVLLGKHDVFSQNVTLNNRLFQENGVKYGKLVKL